jgi:carbon-monoxide dehydrogenase large subunit
MRYVGASVHRVEDSRILTGRGRYVDDVRLPGMLHAAFLRSPLAHARITRIDVDGARRLQGVVAVFTGHEIAAVTKPVQVNPTIAGFRSPAYTPLATDRVRFVGDPVAIVVADSRYIAEDACELIEVDYDPLTPVVTYAAALDPKSPALFDDIGDNVLFHLENTYGDVDAAFAAADVVVRETFSQHRVANVPMETRGAVADYDPGTGELTYHASTQSTHGLRFHLAAQLDHPLEQLRVVCRDVGGAFGLKGPIHREDITLAAASRLIGRPVKWIEDRREHLLASGQAREEDMEIEAAVRSDGMLLGLRAKLMLDQGAYPCLPYPAAMYPAMICNLLPGPYRLQGYSFEATIVATNKCWYVPYRGPWEIETWARERLLDVISRKLALDPADIRRRNLVDGAPGDRIITGPGLAGITSRQSLERALDLGGYEDFRRDQVVARTAGRVLGIGFATFIESAPGPVESRLNSGGEEATVRMEPNGHLLVMTSQGPHGQGHETTLAQVAADEMGVPFEHVRIVHGDTRLTPFNTIGTGGSRAATWASGAVLVTTRRVKEKVLAVAAGMLEIDTADLEIVGGAVAPRGASGKAISLGDVARTAYLASGTLPPGIDHRLEATERFTSAGVSGSGWSGGTHLCVVEIDLGTGGVHILRYLVVEDCGRLINPAIVEGQIRGGVAQGIGGVLYERLAYDAEGQCLTGTFMDYLLPTASEIPTIEIDHIESAHGDGVEFRGVGEGGAIVAPAALTNAIEDALAHLGVRIREQHVTPSRILELVGVTAPLPEKSERPA